MVNEPSVFELSRPATSENVSLKMCAQRKFRSACAFAQSILNLHLAHNDFELAMVNEPSVFEPSRPATSENVSLKMCAQRKFRSACAFAQADLNLHLAHDEKPMMKTLFIRTMKTLIRLCECLFSHVAAQF